MIRKGETVNWRWFNGDYQEGWVEKVQDDGMVVVGWNYPGGVQRATLLIDRVTKSSRLGAYSP